jgi:hypothetical protein
LNVVFDQQRGLTIHLARVVSGLPDSAPCLEEAEQQHSRHGKARGKKNKEGSNREIKSH